MAKFLAFAKMVCGDDGTTDKKELLDKVLDRLAKNAKQEHLEVTRKRRPGHEIYADAADFCIEEDLRRKIAMAKRLFNE